MAKSRKTTSKATKAPVRRVNLHWPSVRRWRQAIVGLLALLILFTGFNYGLSAWYSQRYKNEPLIIGTTFIAPYARHFGLDPKQTLQAMIDEVGFRQFRLVSYWDEIEKTPGVYDFTDLDWQFRQIEAADGKVSLAIGLRQPRWPECHMPDWAATQPMTEWEPQLNVFMKTVMERYKGSPALESYQLENEFFLDVFGICPDHSRERLVREYNFVRAVDTTKPIIITRSNNALGYPLGQPRPDEFGVSVYKRVWDKSITKRYFEYPLPPWFYGSLAGGGEILTGKKLIIHELQMEAWLPDTGQFMMNDLASIPEQNKSMNPERLKDRFKYGKASGIKTIYTWGAEWWYWRKVTANDPGMWNVAKDQVSQAAEENRRLKEPN
ncbi:MAG: hypothetical protein ACR2FM_03525 [Candidatus Saccharimonadales bacterium]